MEWDSWSLKDYLSLARYVTPEATRWFPLDVNRFDLVGGGQSVRYQLIEAIYNDLRTKRIYYDPSIYDPSSFRQTICTPSEILEERQQVACLDLAILFCGLCLGNNLLSTIIVLKDHALAAVSLENWRGTTYRHERSLFDGGILTDPDRFHEFIELIDEHAYLAVECTGFAYSEKLAQMQDERYPESIQRVNGVLEFQQAVHAGRKQLDLQTRPFQAAVDIDLAHKRVEPYPLGASALPPKPFLAPSLPDHGVIGREDLLRDLKQYLFTRQTLTLTALDGLPGAGKTTLAIALAHDPEVRKYFSGGVLWAGLGKDAREADIASHLDLWARALGISLQDLKELRDVRTRQQCIRKEIGQRKMLLVVDDVWQKELALSLRLGGDNCAFLVTTRLPTIASQLSVGGSIRMVEELTEDESLTLLERFVPESVKEVPNEARALAQAVGGLPLALTLMGRYLRTQIHHQQTPKQQRRHLVKALSLLNQTKERFKLEQPQEGLEHHPSFLSGSSLSLTASIDISYRALGREARRMLRSLAVFPSKPNSFSEDAILAVSAASVEALDKLSASGLLERSEQDRHTLHQTIFDYASLKRKESLAEKRMAEYFADYVEDVVGKTSERTLAVDEVNINRALELAHNHGYSELVARLCMGMQYFWRNGGRRTTSLMYLPWGIAAAEELAKMTHKHADYVAQATLAYTHGQVFFQTGRPEEAARFYTVSLTIYQTVGDKKNEGVILAALSRLSLSRGYMEEAEHYGQQALAIHREIKEREEEGVDLSSLAQIAIDCGQLERAEGYLQQVQQVAPKRLQGRGRRIDCIEYSRIAVARKKLDEAQKYLQEALDISQNKTGKEMEMDRRGEAASFNWLGQVALDRGQWEEGKKLLKKALEIHQKVQDQEGEAVALFRLAHLAEIQGDLESAEQQYQESLNIFRTAQLGRYIPTTLLEFGRFLIERRSEPEKGCSMVRDAERRYKQMGIHTAELSHLPSEQKAQEMAQRLDCSTQEPTSSEEIYGK